MLNIVRDPELKITIIQKCTVSGPVKNVRPKFEDVEKL